MSANEAYLSAIQSLLNIFLPSVQMLAVRAQIVCIARHTRDSIIMVRPADIAPTLPELMELGHDRPLAAARRVSGRFAAAPTTRGRFAIVAKLAKQPAQEPNLTGRTR